MSAVFCVIDKKKLALSSLIFSLGILIMFTMLVPILARMYSRLSFFYRYGIQSISISATAADEQNRYIHTGNQLLFFLDREMKEYIDVEVCMQMPNRGVIYPNVLKHGQLVVGTNTARRYGLNVGDIVYAKSSYNSELQNYHIAAIINDCYSPLVVFEQTGMVFAGYDPDFTDSLAIRYILFSAKPLRDLDSIIIQTSYSLISVELLRNSLYALIVFFIGIYGAMFLFLHLLTKNILKMKITEQLLFLYRLGLSLWGFIVAVFFISCCFFVFPFLVAVLLYWLGSLQIIHGYALFSFFLFTIAVMIGWNITIFFKAGIFKKCVVNIYDCKKKGDVKVW